MYPATAGVVEVAQLINPTVVGIVSLSLFLYFFLPSFLSVSLLEQNYKTAATLPANSNAKSLTKIPLNKDKKTGLKRVEKLVGGVPVKPKSKKAYTFSYRPDLVAAAKLRFEKLKKVADVRNQKIKAARPATKRGSR